MAEKNVKKLVVLGGGESGCGTAVLGKKKGWDVFLSDKGSIADRYKELLVEWGIGYEEGKHTESLILEADEVVKSPGIPDSAPIVVALREGGIPVISEIEFAGRYTAAKTICITGSNGKTTTTTLIYNLLRDAGLNVGLAGNIGDSFAFQVATSERDWYVLELSSFQLDGMSDFKADVAVLMNITPDHLDRYNYDMQAYIDSKMRIVRNQQYDDYFIWCDDDQNITNQLSKYDLKMRLLPFSIKETEADVERGRHAMWKGAFLSAGEIVALDDDQKFVIDSDDLKIKGRHNIYNAMAAILAAMAAGVSQTSIRDTLTRFTGVEHRLESAGEIDGVEYVNDSKATNVDSTWYALESMSRPVIWIAGGTDKGNDYNQLKEIAKEKVKAIVCMGADNSKLMKEFEGVVPTLVDTSSLSAAMASAEALAEEGDVVLLSPACASFDLFKNYEDRGQQFKQWVELMQLKND